MPTLTSTRQLGLKQGQFVETLKKRDILQEILTERGFVGWYVIEPSKLNPANCLVFNPKEKKMAEISIPDEWLDDPRHRSTIEESLTSTINNRSYYLPQSYLRSTRLPRR